MGQDAPHPSTASSTALGGGGGTAPVGNGSGGMWCGEAHGTCGAGPHKCREERGVPQNQVSSDQERGGGCTMKAEEVWPDPPPPTQVRKMGGGGKRFTLFFCGCHFVIVRRACGCKWTLF